MLIVPIIAQESQISVQTDDKNYDEGDTISISGNVNVVIGETPVLIQIIHKESKSTIEITQITVAQDGSFTKTVLAEKPSWKNEGIYIIKAFYQDQIIESEFTYTPKSESIETTTNFEVSAGSNGTFDVEYTIKGGIVKDMIVDLDNFAIIVRIESTDKGVISLDLPRDWIGAEKQDGKDDTFIILIDGIEVTYQESIVHSDYRVITINFVEGDSDIEIIGTYVGYHNIASPTPEETGCGTGTTYDPITEWCIIDESPPQKEFSTSQPIPQWVRGVFAFYANGQITDDELKEAIKFLVNSGIIVLN